MPESYVRNFLYSVLCRIDFPVILRLERERPASFQEKVRDRFPKTNEYAVYETQFKPGITPSARMEEPFLQWEFFTRDEVRKITMQRNFLSLEDRAYKDFQTFKENLRSAFEALVELYSPPVITRLGLRYQNLIKMAEGSALDWKGFLVDPLIAHLQFQHGGKWLQDKHEIRLKTDVGHVTLRYGVHNPNSPAPIQDRQFMLDIDCYIRDDLEPGEVLAKLCDLNADAVDMFERSIGESWRSMMRER